MTRQGAGMTDEEKIALLNAFADAWGRGDVDALMGMITDDFVYSASVGEEPGKTYRGREQVEKGFRDILGFEGDGETRAGPVWLSGDYGFAMWSYDHVNDDGSVSDVKGLDVFRFRDNKLCLNDAYRKARA